jgi:hypothetical protein
MRLNKKRISSQNAPFQNWFADEPEVAVCSIFNSATHCFCHLDLKLKFGDVNLELCTSSGAVLHSLHVALPGLRGSQKWMR